MLNTTILLINLLGYLVIAIDGSVDLSNVDLRNFKYFKYIVPPEHNARAIAHRIPIGYRNNQPNVNSLEPETFVKVRAVLNYISGVLFGNLPGEPEIPVVFHPDAAYRSRARFFHHHGYRGSRLVAALGNDRSWV